MNPKNKKQLNINNYRDLESFVPQIIKKISFTHLSREDRQDLFQEICLGLVEADRDFSWDKNVPYTMYLYHRGMYKGIDWFRKRARYIGQEVDDEDVYEVVSTFVMEDAVEQHQIREIIAQTLSEEDQWIVCRYYGLDHFPPATVREIATKIGTSKSSTMRRISGILKALRNKL